jgi:hypothetical protein
LKMRWDGKGMEARVERREGKRSEKEEEGKK